MKQLVPPSPMMGALAILLAADAYFTGGWPMFLAGFLCGGVLTVILTALRGRFS